MLVQLLTEILPPPNADLSIEYRLDDFLTPCIRYLPLPDTCYPEHHSHSYCLYVPTPRCDNTRTLYHDEM